MVKFAGLIVLTLVLVIGVGIGYFSSKAFSGNVILKEEPRSDADGLEPVSSPMMTSTSMQPTLPSDKCKNVNCPASKLTCPDGFNATCNNSCKDSICTACKPDCKGHEIKTSTNQPQSGPSISSSGSSSSSTSSSSTASSAATPSIPACSESWSCTEWSACSNSIQNRTCSDSNNCGSTNSKPSETQACTESQQKQLVVVVAANSQIIVRGNEVIITAKVAENQSPIEGAVVDFTMTYASGTQNQNSGATNSAGEYLWTKTIGGNSKPGTFRVDAKATKSGYLDGSGSITFEVVNATS